jgi:hypothetical protein
MMIHAKHIALGAAFILALLGGSQVKAQWKAVDQPDLKTSIVLAAPLQEVVVGVPIFTVAIGPQWWAPNPDGRTHDVIQWYYQSYTGPNIGTVMDLGTGEVKTIRMPLGEQSRGGTETGPDGKVYHASNASAGVRLTIYDPATNEFIDRGVVVPNLGGERNDLAVGTDGMIYGTGSYGALGKAGAYQINTATGKVTDYGPIGPSHRPEAVWGYTLAADDRYVYVASGKIPWYLVAYDRETGKDSVILETARTGEDLQIQQVRYGAVAQRYIGFKGTYGPEGYDKKIEYWLYQGKAIEKKDAKEPPPWNEPKTHEPWVKGPPRPQTWEGRLQPTREGNAEYWYRYAGAGEAAPNPVASEAATPEMRARAQGWNVIQFNTRVYCNRRTTWIRELADGRIVGACEAYQGNFLYDPATDDLTHPGKIHLSQYSAVVHDGKVWMCGYPSSVLYVWDPSLPWTAQKSAFLGKSASDYDKTANPHLVTSLRPQSGVHHPYAATVGANGLLYFGGRWYRDGIQGGLAWFDPKSGEAGGLRDPFNNYQVHYATTVNDGKWVVLSTNAVPDSSRNTPKPPHGKLFVLDTATNKIIREIEPMTKLDCPGAIAGVGGSRLMGMCNDPDDAFGSLLYGVDAASGDVAFRMKLPFPLEWRVRHNDHGGGMFDFRLGPDGCVWTFIGGALVRIHPEDARIDVVGNSRVGGVLAFSGQDVYMTGDEALRKEPDVFNRLKAQEKK